MELGFWPSDVNYWDPDSFICIPVSKPRIPDSTKTKHGFWIPREKISRNPDSRTWGEVKVISRFLPSLTAFIQECSLLFCSQGHAKILSVYSRDE